MRTNGRISIDITLELAEAVMKCVEKKAEAMGIRVVTAVTDSHGNPVSVRCMDDARIGSFDIALNKAYTSAVFKMSTEELGGLSRPDGSLYGIQFTNNGKIVIFGGGEPLINSSGEIIGGLGVSGGTEEQDSALAAYGKEIFEKGMYLQWR